MNWENAKVYAKYDKIMLELCQIMNHGRHYIWAQHLPKTLFFATIVKTMLSLRLDDHVAY